MSDENISNGEKNSSSINRRRLLKQLGLAGGAAVGVMGSTPVRAESGTSAEDSVEIENMSPISGDEAQNYAEEMDYTEASSLIDGVSAVEDMTPRISDAVGFSVDTNKASVNEVDPVFLVIPMGGKVSLSDKAGLVGLIIAKSQPTNEEVSKVPIAGTAYATGGMSTSPNDSVSVGGSLSDSNNKVRVYGTKDGSATQVNEITVEPQESSPVLTPNGSFSCDACNTLVTGLCSGAAGPIGFEGCLLNCFPLATGVVTYPTCVAACQVILAAIVAFGCTSFSSDICEDTQFC